MTVFERVRMPSLGGATEWLNSEPLGPAEMRGQAVLVDFWTLTCGNWPRTEPYVRAWSQAYRILLPGLPRSTGLAPTWSPTFGAHAGRVHARARPVQAALLADPVEDAEVELLEHARLSPLGKAAPSGRRRAAAEFLGRQQAPGGGGAGHEHDRGEAVAVADSRRRQAGPAVAKRRLS
jgi:hypothetical protein